MILSQLAAIHILALLDLAFFMTAKLMSASFHEIYEMINPTGLFACSVREGRFSLHHALCLLALCNADRATFCGPSHDDTTANKEYKTAPGSSH